MIPEDLNLYTGLQKLTPVFPLLFDVGNLEYSTVGPWSTLSYLRNSDE